MYTKNQFTFWMKLCPCLNHPIIHCCCPSSFGGFCCRLKFSIPFIWCFIRSWVNFDVQLNFVVSGIDLQFYYILQSSLTSAPTELSPTTDTFFSSLTSCFLPLVGIVFRYLTIIGRGCANNQYGDLSEESTLFIIYQLINNWSVRHWQIRIVCYNWVQ